MSDHVSAIIPNTSPMLPTTQRSSTPGTLGARSAAPAVPLAPYLTLARELAAQIVPVRLRDEFRDELQHDLMAAARRQYARDLLLFSAPPAGRDRTSRRWVLGAATLGSAVSLAGIFAAYVVRHRHRQAA